MNFTIISCLSPTVFRKILHFKNGQTHVLRISEIHHTLTSFACEINIFHFEEDLVSRNVLPFLHRIFS